MVDGDRVLDVLELLGAAVDEADVRQLAADLVIDLRRHADRARVRDRFEAGGDVDAVAVEIVALDDDVADIDADAELQRPGVGLRVAGGDGPLALDGADDAETALANSATTESPAEPKMRPWCSAMMASTICRQARRSASVPASSAPISLEN